MESIMEATTSSSEGDTPTGSATTPRPEFKQVKMHAHNQIILTKVLTQDREKVGCHFTILHLRHGAVLQYRWIP